MTPARLDRRGASAETLRARARALARIRAFFDERGYTEVETPVRLPAPALELHIDAPSSGEAFLRTSPELHMKRLLADGLERIYQIGPCFRAGERGLRHHPEFTMLEWYEAGGDCDSVLAETRALLERLGIDLPWESWTVSEAFRAHAGWDPTEHYDADRFDLDLIDNVEPAIPRDRAVVLRDYPAGAAALARRKPGAEHLAERWELYLGGMEIANAYTELTDPVEQRRRFEECVEARRALGKPVYPIDEQFLQALARVPETGGIALGVDRLVMVLLGLGAIDEVRAFLE